ncbi:MAG: endonuclease/exonuclease/phosphatase family protein [Methylocella sp.]
MKLLALNVCRGGGSRVKALCQFLDQHNPDVIVLTEWRQGAAGQGFIAWMEARGFHHAARNDGATRNGTLIAARVPFDVESMTPLGSTAGVLMLARFQGWNLLASYFPQRSAKARFFATCKEVAASHARTPLVIVGDLNTGNQTTDRSAGGRFFCSADFDALQSEAGLVDLWRRTNGPDAREATWLSKKNGFRIDHAFANEPFITAAQPYCVYDHVPRESRATDHSAIVVRAW